jgi:hypothetical protein
VSEKGEKKKKQKKRKRKRAKKEPVDFKRVNPLIKSFFRN